MLTAEQNDELTQVAAGTPMGELLRRYLHPVGLVTALPTLRVVPNPRVAQFARVESIG